MKNIETKVVHSRSQAAWNICGKRPGQKYKIARVPYLIIDGLDWEALNTHAKNEALEHAQFISRAFNNAYQKD